jgi:hypothetical protein
LELEAKLFRENSSSLWDSSVVEDRELESPVAAFGTSLLEPVSLDLQLDFPFSGGVTRGTVRLFVNTSGSKETVETDCSRD